MGVQKAVRSGMITPKVCGFLILGLLFFILPMGGTFQSGTFPFFCFFLYSGTWLGEPDPISLHLGIGRTHRHSRGLTAWIILQAIFISTETVRSLQEITGQWLKPLVFPHWWHGRDFNWAKRARMGKIIL